MAPWVPVLKVNIILPLHGTCGVKVLTETDRKTIRLLLDENENGRCFVAFSKNAEWFSDSCISLPWTLTICGRSSTPLEGTDLKVSEKIIMINFIYTVLITTTLPFLLSPATWSKSKTSLSVEEFICKYYLTQQVDASFCFTSHDVSEQQWLLYCLHFSHSGTALLFQHMCLCLCLYVQCSTATFRIVLSCFWFVLSCLFCFVFPDVAERLWKIVNAHSGSLEEWKQNPPPRCWWQGLMWMGNGRCGKRFPSDCDGLTVVIVTMHLLWFSFSHSIGKIDNFVIKDYLNEAIHWVCLWHSDCFGWITVNLFGEPPVSERCISVTEYLNMIRNKLRNLSTLLRKTCQENQRSNSA